jgi:tRNA threonylcarbamoyladenosine biosynthesis protein TsaB
MPIILHIETSTEVCSALLSSSDRILVEKICFTPQSHAAELPVFLQEILDFARKNAFMPQAVAVSAGPGSYTGLRIGVSSAKGICYGLNIPLLAVDTLKIIAKAAKKLFDEKIFFSPMIDARRMEVYTALFDENLQNILPTEPKIIDKNFLNFELNKSKIVFCGNGSNKCKEIIKHDNAIFLDNIIPLCANMIDDANRRFEERHFEDAAYFEPCYAKDFAATTPKNFLTKQ